MEASKIKIKGKRELALSLVMLVLGAAWAFYIGDRLLTNLQNQWQEIFNVPWREDTPWRSLSIFFLVQFAPALAFIAASWLLIGRAERLNAPALHRNNLSQLAKARDALKNGISSLEVIEKEYAGKLTALEKLRSDIDALQTAKKIDTEELRRTLGAIEQVNRFNRVLQQAAGFVLGVFSSLIATYLWEHL